MNKTHKTAQGLASLGRGPDKLLVHMSPHELHGLQNLAVMHGTSLTINPHTGLPEAGVLSSILPMLAGAAVTYFSGGTLGPVAMAMMQAGAGAATNAAVTGKTDLGTLASGALGGYGGGALTSGLAGAGAAQATQATQVAQQAAQQAAQEAAAQGVAQGAAQAAPAALTQGSVAGMNPVSSFTQSALGNAPAASPLVAAGTSPVGAGAASYADKVAAGAKGLSSLQGWGNLAENMTPSQKMAAGISTLGAVSNASSGGGGGKKQKPTWYMYGDENTPGFDYRTQRYGPATTTRDPKVIQDYLLSQSQMYPPTTPYPMAGGGTVPMVNSSYPTATTPLSGYEPQTDPYSGEELSLADYYAEAGRGQGMAGGGMADQYAGMISGQNVPNQLYSPSAEAQNSYLSGLSSLLQTPAGPLPSAPPVATTPATTTATPVATKKKKKSGWVASGNNNYVPPPEYYNFDPVTQGFASMAGGGLASLNSFSGGGGRFLGGPGDGVSDSIPAEIQGGQKAALAKGEFVIPARHVAELGNGSSEAGAQRLYQMMRRIEAKRRATDFAKDSKAYKDLPV